MQSVTDALNNEFAGIVAEKYYKAVKEAVMKVDDKLLYLGTRLHGTPKYMEGVMRAAGNIVMSFLSTIIAVGVPN